MSGGLLGRQVYGQRRADNGLFDGTNQADHPVQSRRFKGHRVKLPAKTLTNIFGVAFFTKSPTGESHRKGMDRFFMDGGTLNKGKTGIMAAT